METLDDSTKDPWTENGDKVDAPKEGETNNEQSAEKPVCIWQEIRNYECSIGNAKHSIFYNNNHVLETLIKFKF